MERIDKETRRTIVRVIAERYRSMGRSDRQRILDEFVALTGYHRKHAIRLINQKIGALERQPTTKRVHPRVYDEAVREAVVVLWEASDRICGKRLKPLLPVLVAALERHGHLELDGVVREKLLSISAATIDRLLAPTRTVVRSKRRSTRKPSAVQLKVPIRTAEGWDEPPPGYMEGDLVAHCVRPPSGESAVLGSS